MEIKGFITILDDDIVRVLVNKLYQFEQMSHSVVSPNDMNSMFSKVSSTFGCIVPYAPKPANRLLSSKGTIHSKDSGRRRAIKMNIGPSKVEPNRCQEERELSGSCSRTRTGSYVNHKPNAAQKGASFGKLRILYDIRTSS